MSKLAHSIRQANQEPTETDGREVDVDPVDLVLARARANLEYELVRSWVR